MFGSQVSFTASASPTAARLNGKMGNVRSSVCTCRTWSASLISSWNTAPVAVTLNTNASPCPVV